MFTGLDRLHAIVIREVAMPTLLRQEADEQQTPLPLDGTRVGLKLTQEVILYAFITLLPPVSNACKSTSLSNPPDMHL